MIKQKAVKTFFVLVMMLFCMGAGIPGQLRVYADTELLEEVQCEDVGAVKIARRTRYSGGKWIQLGEKRSYRKKDGSLVRDTWCTIGGSYYYFDKMGYVKTGLFSYKGRNYCADASGRLKVKRMVQVGDKTYYYGAQGYQIHARWRKIRGKYYYFTRSGDMAKSTWVGNRYVRKNGALVKNATVQGRTVGSDGAITKPSATDKYIFVGASRIVDMSVAVNDKNTVFIARGGQGFDWLKNCAYRKLKKYLKKNPNSIVVINLGNNDLDQKQNYVSFFETLTAQYPKAKFYYLSVLPGDGSQQEKNVLRQQFNQKMESVFGERYIDGYNYLMSTGFSTVDGTHYTPKTSRKIYRYVMKTIL